jgi:hypothetical protein
VLTALDPTDGMAFLTAPDPSHPTGGMALLTTPDPTAGPVEVGRLSVPGSEGDLNLCSNDHVETADWRRVTAMSSETSETRKPTSRTTPKEIYSRRSDDKSYCASASPSNLSCISTCWLNHSRVSAKTSNLSCISTCSLNHSRASTILSNRSRNLRRLSALGSAEERHLNLCSMASYYGLAAAGPLAKDESCPLGPAEERHLYLCPMASYPVLAAASPLAKDDSCPSLSTSGSNEERYLNLLATLGHAASAPAPTDSQSLTTPGSVAYSSCLLRTSTTYPMSSNASVTQLSHPRLHPPHRRVSFVLIQEPRVQS